MDKITIRDLEVFAHHGVFPEETALGQKFLVSCDLFTDIRKACREDRLDLAIDYGAVCRSIRQFLESRTFHLLETAAQELCIDLLTSIDGLKSIRMEIKKPWAPIGLPLKTVAVEITRSWHRAWLSLGSNLGDRSAYLESAIRALREDPLCRVEKVSGILETEPYGVRNQPGFLNCCLELHTLYEPDALLDLLHTIENDAGRTRDLRWGPRTLDLDIIFFDDAVIDTPDLTVPHPDMQNRDFVLKPLCEIAPWYRHPLLHRTVAELLVQLHGELV